MTIIKGTTKKGQTMIRNASNYEGVYLWQVYDSFSPAKKRAWDYCYDCFVSEHGEAFSIISHNTFGFSVSWVVENGVRIETPKNSYLILFPKFC